MMRMFFVGLLILLIAMSFDANAQFKPAEQQYLSKENLAKNSGFEQGKTGWTNANGTFSLSPTEKISGNNGGCVSLTAQTLDFSQTLSIGYNSNLASLQGQVSAYAKADFAFQVCSLVDGVEQNCLNNSGLNAFDWYGLPTVMGNTSLGIKFKTSGNVTGTFCTDDIDFGAKQISQAIAQSELAGESYFAGTTGCQPIRQSLTIGAFNTDVDCPAPTVLTQNLGEWQTTDANLIRQTINNLPVGEYKATFIIPHENTISARTAWAINDGTTTCEATEGIQAVSGSISVVVTCVFKYVSAGNRVFEIYAGSTNASNEIRIQNQLVSPRTSTRFFLEYYPPKSHIVTQNLEKTVQNSNEFSAKVSSAGVVSGENLDWINGNCTISSPFTTCNFNSDIFTVSPNCVAISTEGSSIASSISSQTSALVAVRNVLSTTGGALVQAVNLVCQKQGVDFNKSQIVHGTFEQIKTTELCKVVAYTNDDDIISAATEDIPWKTKEYDNCNLWSNAGNTDSNTNDAYTARQDGFITASGIFFADSASAGTNNITVYKNGLVTTIQCGIVDNTAFQTHFSCIIPVAKNDVITFRSAILKGLLVTATHRITIMEEPDLAGIVKNLNDNKNVKCQTKYLSASTGTLGVIADLTFNNLVIGKKYEINFNHAMIWTGTGQAVNQVSISNGSQICNSLLGGQHNGGNGNFSVGCLKIFTATATTLTHNLTASGVSTLFGSASDAARTNATLCELPDNYIETTEF